MSNNDQLSQEATPPVAAPKRNPLHVGANVEWRFDSVVLRTTFRQCVCGTRHRNVDLFECWTAPGKLMGKTHVATQLRPIHKAAVPFDVEIVQTTEIIPLAICPDCISSRPQQAKLPPLDHTNWTIMLRRKAQEEADQLKAAKAAAKKPEAPSVASLADIDKLLGFES